MLIRNRATDSLCYYSPLHISSIDIIWLCRVNESHEMQTFFLFKVKKISLHAFFEVLRRKNWSQVLYNANVAWMDDWAEPSICDLFFTTPKIFLMQCVNRDRNWYKLSVVHLFFFYELYSLACSENGCDTLIIFKPCLFLKECSQRKNWKEKTKSFPSVQVWIFSYS